MKEIKHLDVGICMGNFKLCILLYADDIVLLAENEVDLQKMLDVLHAWCCKMRLGINREKTQVIHFRKKESPVTSSVFNVGSALLKITQTYKYEGIPN